MLGEDYVKFFNLNLFLWRHLPVSSVRLLRVLGGSARRMASFNDVKEYFGFKSENCPPQCRDLLGFESDLYEMARSVKFKRVNKPFQRQLASDAKMINTSASLFVPADKTTNLYKVDSRTYDKLLQNNITASY